jgi:hypothetical protein
MRITLTRDYFIEREYKAYKIKLYKKDFEELVKIGYIVNSDENGDEFLIEYNNQED